MSDSNAVQKGLKLGRVPRGIEKHNPGFSNQVHAVRGIHQEVCTEAIETFVSGVNIKIISQVLNHKFPVFLSENQSLDKVKKHKKGRFHP
jgi:hypothetical protein